MPWLKSCLSPRQGSASSRKKPAISPPLHLLLKPEADSQNHAFRTKVFKRPRPCHLCHQPIHQLGSCCRVCKYVCHKACESKYIKDVQPSKTSAKGKGPALTATLRPPNNNNNISTLPNNNNSSSGSSLPHKASSARSLLAGSGGPGGACKDGMDLRYVTERIIALWVPGDVERAAYRQGQQQAANMLRTKHGENYMVFNLSAPRRALRHHHSSVLEMGWPRDLAPPLDRLCSICKEMDTWLKGDTRRIAVVHARGSKDRIGVVVAAYMHYSQICGGADQALDRFAMKRFLQDQVEDVEQPSHRRYVDYFSGLLSGTIRINSAPLYLTHVTVLGAPSFEPHAPDGPDPGGGLGGARGPAGGPIGGCRAFLKVYEGLVPVHTSAVYCVAGDARAFTVNVAAERGRRGLQLRGDVLVKCYHRHYRKCDDSNEREVGRGAREIVFACQFHTCAVSDYTLSFTRSELDSACDDLRFPLDGAVELHFSPTPEVRLPSPAPTPAVLTLDSSDDPVTRWDSYERLYDDDPEGDEVNHTFGPLDGSLYATIGRKQQLQQEQQQRRQLLQQQQEQHIQLQQQRRLQQPQHPQLQQLQHAQTVGTDLAPLATNSEHTVSMDSGISSAGNGLPSTQQASSPGQDDKQRALDELLSDMLLTVESIPDFKPTASARADLQRSQRTGGESRYYRPAGAPAPGPPPRRQSSLAPVRDAHAVPVPARASSTPATATSRHQTNPDDDVEEIPYHARPDGRPFTYVPGAAGAQAQGSPDPSMLHTQTGLSSPGLVRKASFKGYSPSNGAANGYATSTPRISNGGPRHFDEYARTYSGSRTQTTPGSPDPLLDGLGSGGVPGGGRSHLTWLQRQQQKLRERREGALRSARLPHETRLLSELRSLHHSHSASRRADGYTSDTTMFADEDEEDLCRPLHINTSPVSKLNGGLSAPGSPLQRRIGPGHVQHLQHSQPYPLSRQKSDSSFDRERPFVAVKRGFEQQRKYTDSAASPYDRLPNNHHYSNTSSPTITDGTRSRVTYQNYQPYQHHHVNGVGTNGTGGDSGLPSPDVPDGADLLLLDAALDDDLSISRAARGRHQDALACLMASLTSPSTSPSESASSMSMTPSPPGGAGSHSSNHFARQNSHARHASFSSHHARPSNASDCSTNSSCAWQTLQREESYSSWRTEEGGSGSPRPHTPAFPVHPRTPYSNNGQQQFDTAGLPPKSPTTQRKDRSPSPLSDPQHSHGIYMQHSPKSPVTANGGQSSPNVYTVSRRSSTHSNSEPPQEVAPHHVKFVRDTSRYWYKPHITREEAIALLKDAPPGTFVVRDSNSFPGAFGMALKVANPPATVAQKAAFFSGDSSELVRHFLIEPTSRGVKLKGCSNEPVFSSLSALVYQHSLMAMALPCKLLLPDGEISGPTGALVARHVSDVGSSPSATQPSSAQQLLAQGAACNVLYLFTTDTESLTGPQAIRRAVQQLFMTRPLPTATIVHFKVSSQGITLTDNKRRLFFRRHYPVSTISHCGLDPDDHRWSQKSLDTGMPISSNRCFGFVARKPASRSDNQCHIFAELEPEQPANAIVNFVSKVMMSGASQKANIV